jgi:hypothetical protein
MLLLMQSSPAFFAMLAGILGLLVGSFGSDITRKRVSLHRNYRHD